MNARGRPRLPAPTRQVHVTLSLRPGEDDDLIDFFSVIPERMRASAIKTALRSGNAITRTHGQAGIEMEEDLGDFLLA